MARKKDLTSLAIAIASGRTVRSWAEEHKISLRAAYAWAKLPETVRQVESIRSKALDRVVGRLVTRAMGAVDRITRLSSAAANEAVRLSACRALLSDLMSLRSHVSYEKRFAELEKQIDEKLGRPPGTP